MVEENKSIWESAGKAGLALGGVSILYTLCTMLTGKLAENGPVFLISVVNVLLWIAKFTACLYLMRLFMLRYSHANPAADNARVFRFGMLTALFSSLLYSAFYLAYVSFIQPDTFAQAMEAVMDNPMIDSNSADMLEAMIPRMPTISFFVNLIYCWLFGTILSAIYSRNIPPQNPFADEP